MAITYNGIALTAQNTMTQVMGPVKDPSGSDQMMTKILIKVRAIINMNLLPAIAADNTFQQDVAGTIARIRHYLTQPRCPLYYDNHSPPGTTGLGPAFINLPSGRDDAGGPWPDANAFEIAYLTERTCEVFWACVVHLRDCGATVPTEPLSLRWEDSISYDETWKATYRRQGVCIISSLQANNIDWFRRNKLSVPVCAGFKRVQSQYAISKDGLRCDFSFTDEQLRFAPPYPGVKLEIVQSESGPLHGGMGKGAIQVKMVGIQNANVVQLSALTMAICKSRMWAQSPLSTRGIVIGNFVLETRENETGVECSAIASYKVNPNAKRLSKVNVTLEWKQTFPIPFPVINAQPTQQGKDPTGMTYFPWVGFGTSPVSGTNPGGYAQWANPTGSVGGPVDGIDLANAVGLYAALLNDPCGRQLLVNPNVAPNLTNVELHQDNPAQYTQPSEGNEGQPPFKTSDLLMMTTGLLVDQYPANIELETDNSVITWDGAPGVYDHWQSVNEYKNETGTAILPTSDPSATNSRVDYQSKMYTVVKKWAARRTGAPPRIPSQEPDADQSNWVLIHADGPGLRELGVAADGVSVVYEAYGEYTYQALDPTQVVFGADIPPTLSAATLGPSQGWANQYGTLGIGAVSIIDGLTGLPAPPSLSGGGGSIALGNGTLPFITPP